MGVAASQKAKMTLRYWEASLAWKDIDNWAKGWTTGDFIEECRKLCYDQGFLGKQADELLDDVVYDIERKPKQVPAEVFSLRK